MYMEINDIIINVQEYGYLALFFCLWLALILVACFCIYKYFKQGLEENADAKGADTCR